MEIVSLLIFFLSFIGESVSTDSIRNCIKVFEKWSVIEISSCTGVRLISLGAMFDGHLGIENTIQKIQKVVPFYNN